MALAYSSPGLLPYTCAVYLCACGRTAELHDVRGGLPEGWVEIQREGELDHLCPWCVEPSGDPKAP